MDMIEINGLRKYYGKHMGVEELSFSVKKGELFGFVGPNGAGKSTTIKLLLNFIFPSGGSASICGKDIVRDSREIKKFTAYVPGNVRFYENMTSEKLMSLTASFYPGEYREEAERLSMLFELDKSKHFYELSMGNKKKAAIICALITKPAVLLLDEPTNGLDPMMQKRLFLELKEQTDCGMTILLSSHNLTEVQEYCDRVAFIKNGKISAITNLLDEKNPGKIISLWGGKELSFDHTTLLNGNSQKRIYRYDGKPSLLPSMLAQWEADDFIVENESLESRFMDLYEEKVRPMQGG